MHSHGKGIIVSFALGTAWEAADGTRALMFANATDYPQDVAYRWKGTSTRTTFKPYELRLVPVER